MADLLGEGFELVPKCTVSLSREWLPHKAAFSSI